MRPILKWSRAVCLCSLFAAQGCIAPFARAHQEDAPATAMPTSYKVPVNWDYRAYYKIPQQRLKTIVQKYIGTRYRYGGSTRKGMDCSGFVKAVFTELNHARMPRSSKAMSRLGRPVEVDDAKGGDLVFFRGGALNKIDHVGIWMGDGTFVHASKAKGVTYDSLGQEYYRDHFAYMRRLF